MPDRCRQRWLDRGNIPMMSFRPLKKQDMGLWVLGKGKFRLQRRRTGSDSPHFQAILLSESIMAALERDRLIRLRRRGF